VRRRPRRAADRVDLARDGDFTPLDGFSSVHANGSWLTFVINAASGDHEGLRSGDDEIEVANTQTGAPAMTATDFPYLYDGSINAFADITALTVDRAGDVAWIATVAPIPAETSSTTRDQVGLFDRHGMTGGSTHRRHREPTTP
jgi:hypothetical protein